MLRKLPTTATSLVLALLIALALTACSSASGSTPVGSATGGYPMTLTSPYGETVLTEKPTKVAAMSSVDLDIALALGIVPVTSPRYGDVALDPWAVKRAAELGVGEIPTYDSTDGTDLEAIAAADPDVILATSGWTLEEDFAQLAKIAPVVSYTGPDGLTGMTWRERTKVAGDALGLADEAAAVTASVDNEFAAAKAANPEFAGKTFTYIVLHPDQISYVSYQGSDNEFFTSLGFVLPENAQKFGESNSAVSRENLNLVDADVLMVGYPFGEEGLMTQAALEADPLFTSLNAVQNGNYLVIGDEASPLAYPTPLSQTWVLAQLTPRLKAAVAGN